MLNEEVRKELLSQVLKDAQEGNIYFAVADNHRYRTKKLDVFFNLVRGYNHAKSPTLHIIFKNGIEKKIECNILNNGVYIDSWFLSENSEWVSFLTKYLKEDEEEEPKQKYNKKESEDKINKYKQEGYEKVLEYLNQDKELENEVLPTVISEEYKKIGRNISQNIPNGYDLISSYEKDISV